ncbi:MAG: prephenate dehydrogenase/arogenate dehydrogenase family protein [Opitutaceae bacterium]
MNPPTLTVLAPGLLGASVARAARRYRAAGRIKVWARRPETRLALQQVDWCDQVCATPGEATTDSDIIVVCTPVERIVPLIREVSDTLSATAIVTDVGSVKGEICRFASAALSQGARFVGSHPMAGSEKSGMDHADPELFRERACFVTPLDDTPVEATERIAAFWNQLGAEVVTMHPDLHDEVVAHVSHLPHLAASALCNLLARRTPNWHLYAGGGLRDTTRVASGNPSLWVQILLENRDEILRALSAYQDEIQAFQTALANRDTLQLRAYLERGKSYRDQFRS